MRHAVADTAKSILTIWGCAAEVKHASVPAFHHYGHEIEMASSSLAARPAQRPGTIRRILY